MVIYHGTAQQSVPTIVSCGAMAKPSGILFAPYE